MKRKKHSITKEKGQQIPTFWWDMSFALMLVISLGVATFAELKQLPEKMELMTINTLFTWIVYLNVTETVSFRLKKFLQWCVYLMGITFGVYLLLRLHSVYDLPKYLWVQQTCSKYPLICQFATSFFFKLKVYRFVTLSIPYLLSIWLFFLGLDFVGRERQRLQVFLGQFKNRPILLGVIFGTLLLAMTHLFFVGEKMVSLSLKAWQTRNIHFADRFVEYEFGVEHHGWIWVYAQFIQKYVPEQTTVFIPPQSDIWPQEGNKYYFRWFMYPRFLLQSSDPNALIPNEAEYVLISRGSWKGSTGGWPKKQLPLECIERVFIIHRQTLQEREISASELENILDPEIWGIMKLAKNRKEICQ